MYVIAWTITSWHAGMEVSGRTVDATGRNVLIANFASGSVSVLRIEADGSLGETSTFIQHEGSSIDPKRQDEDYGRFAWVYDPEENKIELWEPK